MALAVLLNSPLGRLALKAKDKINEQVISPKHAEAEVRLVKKYGFVSQKRRSNVTVTDEYEKSFTFSLDDIDATIAVRKFDYVILFCEVEQNLHLIEETEPICDVRKIEFRKFKQITGKITSLESGHHGFINENHIFYWDALSADYSAVNQDDLVTADCVACHVTPPNDFPWRCIKVAKVETENTPNVIPTNKFTENKNGIEITDDLRVEFSNKAEKAELTMTVKNTSAEDVNVLESWFRGKREDSQLKLVSPMRKSQFCLKPGDVKVYKFEATATFVGKASEQFVIAFNGKLAGNFQISRFIEVQLYDERGEYRTVGTGPNVQNHNDYTRKILTQDRSATIAGTPPISAPNFVAVRFDERLLPATMRDIVFASRSTRASILDGVETVYPHLFENLTIDSYSQVFHDLLYLEECEMENNIRKYDKKSYFTREKEYLVLTVQNVAESRPSIVIGDHIFATHLSAIAEDKKVRFRGAIHDVQRDRILLKFDESFRKNYKNEDYEITFHFSRMPLMKQHHAIDLAMKNLSHEAVLFPNEVHEKTKQTDVSLDLDNGRLLCNKSSSALPWFNPSLNIVQKQAVTNILQGVARPMPYVIVGPPGTGKTVTVIETILQLIATDSRRTRRILVATPSNSSANLITQLLIESGVLKQKELMRLVSHNNVHRDSIPADIIRYCGKIDIARPDSKKDEYKITDQGLQLNCNANRLKSYRLLIGTCITLGTLMQCDFPNDHFTHVVVDESGQCLETEIMIPISFVDRHCGQIVLAGDHKQLGPMVLSHFAKKLGLDRSFLVRLLDQHPYRADPERFEHRFDPRLVTRLLHNYRSLPNIMNIYSEMFYDNDLKAMVNATTSDEAQILNRLQVILPVDGKPNTHGVIFVNVEGSNKKNDDSPSWYNREEADSVLGFFIKLIKQNLSADDIGIITPYAQQVKKIRALIADGNYDLPKIGTVEEFQGQERKIILLSTVRTSQRQLPMDERYSLGFVRSPERMNVAISRARALLVIFGSQKLLSQNQNWKRLIQNCIDQKSAANCVDILPHMGYDSE